MSEFDAILDKPEQSSAPAQYAGFWMRFGALIIDSIVLTIPIVGSFFLFFSYFENSLLPGMIQIGSFMGLVVAAVVIHWLYFAMMESGKNQGTLGKMALGIKVTDMSGDKVSFLRSCLNLVFSTSNGK